MLTPDIRAELEKIHQEATGVESPEELAEAEAEAQADAAAEIRQGSPLEIPPELEDFDPEVAMNTEGFAQFLAKFPDAETFDPSDAAKLEMRYRSFVNMNPVAEGMSDIMQRELALQDLGLEFTPEELVDNVEMRMEHMAIEDPEKLNLFHETMQDYHLTIAEIVRINANIRKLDNREDLDGKLAALRDKEATLKEAEKVSGFLSRKLVGFRAAYEKFAFEHSVNFSKEWLAKNEGEPPVGTRAEKERFVEERSSARKSNEARIKVKDEYEIDINPEAITQAIMQTQIEITETEKQLATLDALEGMRMGTIKRYEIIREVLVEATGASEALRTAAIDAASDRLYSLLEDDPETALEFFQAAQAASAGNAFGVEYFKGEEAETLKLIQTRIQQTVARDVMQAVLESPIGSNAYGQLVQSLQKFLGREKIGTKQGDEARGFVVKTLSDLAGKIGRQDKAKGILVRFALAKLSAIN